MKVTTKMIAAAASTALLASTVATDTVTAADGTYKGSVEMPGKETVEEVAELTATELEEIAIIARGGGQGF
ncbi:MAG: hypothetical protein AB4352_16500 [Hormoscilla sp.]